MSHVMFAIINNDYINIYRLFYKPYHPLLSEQIVSVDKKVTHDNSKQPIPKKSYGTAMSTLSQGCVRERRGCCPSPRSWPG